MVASWRSGDFLHPGQPRPLGHRAAANAGIAGLESGYLRDDTRDFLGRLPASRRLECEGRIIELYHGSPAGDTEYVTAYKPLPPSIEQFWDQSDAGFSYSATHTSP